ncbi:MAG: 50S ribosomal protein L10 [Paludibacteraceae bacterium]|jgi:large subunit ribosomal protein L10|nr:50S ribosomal protein L10 [Paludibacteraceae bacterium]
MRKEDKNLIIESLKEQLGHYSHFYLTDIEGLNAQKTSDLRRACFKNEIKLVVVKNTLLEKALEGRGVDELFVALKGNTALMLSNTGNAPARLIKELREKDKKNPDVKPQLKAAYVEESIYVGADQLETLATIKSKNELIADVIALLQSPAKTVVSALQSGQNTLHGVLKTLGEREA